ncbi:unnamed protein product, partial [Amoebophrya sp. A25]
KTGLKSKHAKRRHAYETLVTRLRSAFGALEAKHVLAVLSKHSQCNRMPQALRGEKSTRMTLTGRGARR